MTTSTDLDLGLDFDELEKEEARANRPSYNHNPVCWEGELVSITAGQDVNSQTGEVFPRHAFNFEKTKFIDVGNAVGEYTDGQPFTLLIRPVTEEQKTKRTVRFTEMGKSALASGKGLEKFLHQRVRVTELAETYKANNGYDRQSYHWKFEQLSSVPGLFAAASAEPSTVELATIYSILASEPMTQAQATVALAKDATLQKNTALIGSFYDGKFFTTALAEGKLKFEDGVFSPA